MQLREQKDCATQYTFALGHQGSSNSVQFSNYGVLLSIATIVGTYDRESRLDGRQTVFAQIIVPLHEGLLCQVKPTEPHPSFDPSLNLARICAENLASTRLKTFFRST